MIEALRSIHSYPDRDGLSGRRVWGSVLMALFVFQSGCIMLGMQLPDWLLYQTLGGGLGLWGFTMIDQRRPARPAIQPDPNTGID